MTGQFEPQDALAARADLGSFAQAGTVQRGAPWRSPIYRSVVRATETEAVARRSQWQMVDEKLTAQVADTIQHATWASRA